MMDFNGLSPKDVKNYIKENFKEALREREALIQCLEKDPRKTINCLKDFFIKEEEKYNSKLTHGKSLMDFDKSYGRLVCGVDEVGRGPLAGPIVGACVLFDTSMDLSLLEDLLLFVDDSKKLNGDLRAKLVPIIKEHAKAWSIASHSNIDIDTLGLAYCNNNIFIESLKGVLKSYKPEIVLSDGYYIKNCQIKNEKVIKGDGRSLAIACASILAKEYRDSLMRELHNEFPEYLLSTNVGYASKDHIEAIKKYGPTKIHRMSFLSRILANEDELIEGQIIEDLAIDDLDIEDQNIEEEIQLEFNFEHREL